MSNFDIEQCKRDGGLAIHEPVGEVKIIVYEKDPDGYLVAVKIKDQKYYLVGDIYLTNIPKKKKITIYVYLDDVNIWASSEHLPCENNQAKLIDTIEKEYEI